MSEHTNCRLVVSEAGDFQKLKIDAKGSWFNGLFLSDGTFEPADARRLAACWNACQGMTTESIEALETQKPVARLLHWTGTKRMAPAIAARTYEEYSADEAAASKLWREGAELYASKITLPAPEKS